jgi:predicted ATP-dependent endonuclease of OLD family
MNEPIKYISKVEIKNLWGRYDLEWNLDPAVNILSGINGSGKSTVLKTVSSILTFGVLLPKNLRDNISCVKIIFNNKENLVFEKISGSRIELEEKAQNDKHIKEVLNNLKKDDYWPGYDSLIKGEFDLILLNNEKYQVKDVKNQLSWDSIFTFDKPLNKNASPNEDVKTELDRDIFFLNQRYLAYQNNILNKTVKALSNSSDLEDIKNITRKRERLLDIIDILFEDTGKKVDRNIEGNSTDLTFISGKDELTPYQLSSGEKQILVILLTVLVQDNKPSILFMDEPEISLHLDWQRKLIQYIKELNPNVQIILATHSPGIILEGWADKVSEMSDLITLDRQAKLENAK